jgi:hypothetical protein
VAFLRGRKSFTPCDLTATDARFLIQVPLEGDTSSARDIGFRRSPLTSLSMPPKERRNQQGPEFQIPSGGEDAPRNALRHSLGRFGWNEPASTVILGSSGLPEGGRIPPGGYPIDRGARLLRSITPDKSSCFLVHQRGEDVLGGLR